MTSSNREGTSDLFEAMATMRAIRRWQDAPVPDHLTWKVIEAATRAPNGGNRQPWDFIVVTDHDQRVAIGRLVRQHGAARIAELRDELRTNLEPSRPLMVSSALGMFEHFEAAPVLIVPCLLRPAGERWSDGFYAGSNIFPAVQNLLLAARGLGLGSVLTTLHRTFDPELRALLAIPDDVQPCCIVPMAFPASNFGPTRRQPVEAVTHWGRWGALRGADGRAATVNCQFGVQSF